MRGRYAYPRTSRARSSKRMKVVPRRRTKPVKKTIFKRPKFSKKPIPRRKEIKKFHHTSDPIEVDATWDVALALLCPIPIGLMTGFGLGSATVRAMGYMATEGLKVIKERAEEAREAEKEGERVT